jgi:hypothetical protein
MRTMWNAAFAAAAGADATLSKLTKRSEGVARQGSNEFQGVIRFPQVIHAHGEKRSIVAWFSAAGQELPVAQLEALQGAYDSALEVANRDGRPLIRYEIAARSADHARTEALTLQRLIKKHLGVLLMLQPEELGNIALRRH